MKNSKFVIVIPLIITLVIIFFSEVQDNERLKFKGIKNLEQENDQRKHIISNTNEKSLFICPNLADIEPLGDWKAELNKRIQNIFSPLVDVDTKALEAIATQSQLGLQFFRENILFNLDPISVKALSSTPITLADNKKLEVYLTAELLRNNQFILEIIESGGLDSTEYYYFGTTPKSPVSLLISSNFEDKYKLIGTLLQRGINTTFQDLVYAIHNNIDLTLFSTLYDRVTGDTNEGVFINGVHFSFSQLALMKGNLEVFRYLLNKGDPLEFGNYDKNAFDYLLENVLYSDMEIISLSNEFISKYKLLPTLVKNRLKLEDIVDTMSEEYSIAQQKLTLKNLTDNQKYTVNATIHEIYFVAIDSYGINKDMDIKCLPILGSNIINEFKDKLGNKKHQNATIENSSIATAIPEYDFDQNALDSLATKRQQEKNKADQIIAMAESIEFDVKQRQSDLLIEEEQAHSNDQEPTDYTKLLNLAIANNEPDGVVLQYAQNGGIIHNSSILFLIRDGRVSLSRELKKFDLNILNIGKMGYTAVHYCVILRSPKMLAYVIEEGGNVDAYNEGFDPLDLALDNFMLIDNVSSEIVRLLIMNGAIIKQSHKELVVNSAKGNMELYIYLTNHFPSLLN